MRRIAIAALAFGLAACLPVLAQNVSTDPAQTPSGNYTVNVNHTQVLFSVLHLGLTEYHGRFDKVSGTLHFDGKQPDRSAVTITIDTSSVDVPSQRLTGDLKSEPALDAQHYPEATFKSTSIVRTGPTTGRITGLFTLRGVTHPVTLETRFYGGGRSPLGGSYSLGFHASCTIRRSDFGLNHMVWSQFVSDDVQLTIEALFDQQKG